MHLLLTAKNLERIGDHATNLAEITFFVVTGQPMKEERPKVIAVPQPASSFLLLSADCRSIPFLEARSMPPNSLSCCFCVTPLSDFLPIFRLLDPCSV